MNSSFIIIILFSFLLSFDSKELLYDLNDNKTWNFISEKKQKNIYEYTNKEFGYKYLKIEEEIDFESDYIFETIKNIKKYNDIISNKNLHSDLVDTKNDTLYGYQLIKNSMPFTRDRQYVFKMYQVSNDRIDWYILGKDHNYYNDLFNSNAKTLNLGAGSWIVVRADNKIILTYKIFVEDEVNMPDLLIQRFRINHVVDIFNDVLNVVKK